MRLPPSKGGHTKLFECIAILNNLDCTIFTTHGDGVWTGSRHPPHKIGTNWFTGRGQNMIGGGLKTFNLHSALAGLDEVGGAHRNAVTRIE